MDSIIKFPGGWEAEITNLNGEITEASNICLRRTDKKFFHITFVENLLPNGNTYPAPMTFQHGNGEKIGDVAMVLRKSPQGRWMIWCEEELVFVTETETKTVLRAKRASLDNPDPAIKRAMKKVGEGYADPKRLGGQVIFHHYAAVNWSPQLAKEMVDIYDYVAGTDQMGQSVIPQIMKDATEEVARELLEQLRTPLTNN